MFTAKEIKITMRYYGITRDEAVATLEDGNEEALQDYFECETMNDERDYYASEVC